MLGVRELDQSGIEGSRNWSNLHTVYTHGNGVIAAYANQRPRTTAPSRPATSGPRARRAEDDAAELYPDGYEGRIYFGEKSPDYSIVGKSSADGQDIELDLGTRPSEDAGRRPRRTTVTAVSTSAASFSQVLYAVKFGEPNFVLSGRVNDNTKILYYRDPRERSRRSPRG